jgi:hypothetical protein
VMAIIFISVLPMVVEAFKARREEKQTAVKAAETR